ncbi:MAG: MFS transporter [Candidatus Zhuqueibacterota bacterium]
MNESNRQPALVATLSWILYDFANTIYSMNVVSMYFTTWIVVELALGDHYVSYANSFSMILVALTLPILGEISDRYRRKMPFLLLYTLICIVFTAGIGIAGYAFSGKMTMVAWAIVFFVIANYSYQGGLVFYNALLPQVSSEKSIGRVSGYGVAVGYLGSIVGLLLVRPFVNGHFSGLNIPFLNSGGSVAAFIPTALLFLIFALPIFFFVKDEPTKSQLSVKRLGIKNSFRKVLDGISNTKKYPGVARFLVAKFFYEDAIETVIIFMAVYTQKVMGFSASSTTNFFIVLIPSAIIGSAFFGIMTDHFGPKRTLMIVLIGWIVCLTALVLTMKAWLFWVLGGLIGIFMGSTWTSARPLLISLVPKEMLGEFFGLYSLSGKLAAIFGPLVWAGIVSLFSEYGDVFKYKAAIFSLSLLILIGLLILNKVPDKKSHSFNKTS